MNLTRAIKNIRPALRWMLFLAVAASLPGCGREQISVYTAPKDAPPTAVAQSEQQNVPSDAAVRPKPQVGWTLPPGWTETGPDAVSLQSFSVSGSDGQVARISLTQLGDLSGRNAMLVNMWRQQAGLPSLSDDDALKLIQPVQFGTEQGSYFEVLGTNNGEPFEILTAFLHRPDGSWFCKISGNPSLLAAQKPVFMDFLKSIQIKNTAVAEDSTPATTASQDNSTSASPPNWRVPSDWQALPAGEMQVARFHVPEQNNAKAEVSVSVFPTEAGGTLANVNRWRTKFVGLAPVGEKDLPQLLSPLDPANPGAVLVDMQKDNKRLIGAIVPRAGSYWFYKLVGETAAVAPQKESFIAFAKSNP
ncbi:MAG TPA: hypothetical protein VN048_09695 [Verrucomicrobiae bacterium]|nr:hypothetical protein [Verrucomicrobiae bacterium]